MSEHPFEFREIGCRGLFNVLAGVSLLLTVLTLLTLEIIDEQFLLRRHHRRSGYSAA
jgi:hypothetical protein